MKNIQLNLSTVFIVLLCSYSVFASAIDRKSLYPFKKDSSIYEIHRIDFVGNNSFPNSELFPIISSKTTDLNFVHELLEYFYEEGNENKYTPKTILNSLEYSLKPFQIEYKFLNDEKIRVDSISISNFYNKNGFHLSKIDYRVYADTISKANVLEFIIEENERFEIDTIVILGLDSLDNSTKSKILKTKYNNGSKLYDENILIQYIYKLNTLIENSGYFFVRKIDESIIIKKDKFKDSVTVIFDTGNRYKFGEIRFVDVKRNQHKVTDNQKKELLDWKEGEYYSKYKVDKSVRNLLTLGTFNSVSIDTVKIRDTIIDYVVITNYRNQNELLLEPGVNQTQNLFYNVFIESNYTHRNIFGEGQVGGIKASILNRDLGTYLTTKRQGFSEYMNRLIDEFYIGANYYDPYIFSYRDASFGLNFAPYYSLRRIENFFNLENIFFPISLPVRFKTDLDVSNLSFNLNFEHQRPRGFDEFVESGFEEDDENFGRIFQSLLLYSDLNNYFNNTNNIFSSIQISGRATRDKRDNPFLPTKGHLISAEVEWAPLGLTNYLRILASSALFDRISKKEVMGYKFKFGGVLFFEEGNRYVSLDKQFFSGGANSVRGWASRRLRYTNTDISDFDGDTRRLLENFVGNSFMIESSIEYRLSFGVPEVNLGGLNEHIASMGWTLFLDAGNSYGWLLDENDFNIGDLIYKLGVSGGTGLTYETPVGPIRIDIALPLYGPINYKYNTVWNTEDALSNLSWHIGLGYSF